MTALSDLFTSIAGTAGCLAAYNFQETEGTTATDAKGNSNGTYTGTPWALAVDGPMGGVAAMNRVGTTKYVNVPYVAAFSTIADVFTFVAMFRRTDVIGNNETFLLTRSASWAVKLNNNKVNLYRNGFGIVWESTELVTDIHKWHLLVVRKNGATISVRLDGAALTKGAGTDTTYAANTNDLSFAGYNGGLGMVALAGVALFEAYVADGAVTGWEAAWTGKPAPVAWNPLIGVHGERQGDGSQSSRLDRNAIDRAAHLKAVRSKCNLATIAAGVTEPGSGDWAAHDAAYREVEQAGLQNVVFLFGSPEWMNGSATNGENVPGAGSASAPAFLTWLDEQADWADRAVRRYMPGGTAGLNVRYWEAWNEPNLLGFWNTSGAVSSAQYAAYWNRMKTTFAAIDASYNTPGHIQLACAALSLPPAGAPNVSGMTYLDDLVATHAITFPILSIHPYDSGTGAPDVNAGTSEADYGGAQWVRDYLAEKGRSSTKLWLTEWGWGNAAVSEPTRSTYLTTAMQMCRDYWAGFVDMSLWYSDSDMGGDDFGLLSGTGAPYGLRPAAYAMSNFAITHDPGRFGAMI